MFTSKRSYFSRSSCKQTFIDLDIMAADQSNMSMRKIFIQRDYAYGTGVRFSTEFPRELTGKVSISVCI